MYKVTHCNSSTLFNPQKEIQRKLEKKTLFVFETSESPGDVIFDATNLHDYSVPISLILKVEKCIRFTLNFCQTFMTICSVSYIFAIKQRQEP